MIRSACLCSSVSQLHFLVRKHMQIEKARANQENIFISLTADGANAHNTNKYILFAARFFFWLCCEHLQRVRCQTEEVVFSICSALSSLGHRSDETLLHEASKLIRIFCSERVSNCQSHVISVNGFVTS